MSPGALPLPCFSVEVLSASANDFGITPAAEHGKLLVGLARQRRCCQPASRPGLAAASERAIFYWHRSHRSCQWGRVQACKRHSVAAQLKVLLQPLACNLIDDQDNTDALNARGVLEIEAKSR